MINNLKKKKKKNCTFSGTEVIKYSRNRKATKKEPEWQTLKADLRLKNKEAEASQSVEATCSKAQSPFACSEELGVPLDNLVISQQARESHWVLYTTFIYLFFPQFLTPLWKSLWIS